MRFLYSGLFGWSYLHVLTHPWIVPREMYYRVKWFLQRGWNGFSDRDNWSIDNYLMEILPKMLENLRKNTHGYPVDLTAESWDEILKTIIVGFEAHRRLIELDFDIHDEGQQKRLKEQSDLSFSLFVKHFDSLWD